MRTLRSWVRDRFSPDTVDETAIDNEGRELLRARYYVGFEMALLMALIGFFVIAALAWNQTSRTGLLVWMGLALLTAPIPVLIRMAKLPIDEWARWLWKSELTLGTTWASFAVLAMPSSAGLQGVLGATFAATLIGASASASQFRRTFFAFTVPIAVIGSLGFILNGTGQAKFLAVLIICAFCFCVSLGAEQRELQLELVLAIQRNKRLVSELEVEQTKLLDSNERLTAANTHSERLARTDPLTGLSNRYSFAEQMAERLSALGDGSVGCVTLAFVDLDRFKAVNDSAGHRAGDLLLTYVAERLQEVARPGESLSRIGGDELVMLSHDPDARAVGARLQRVFDEPFSLCGDTRIVTGSIGVATVSGPVHPDELIRRADEAQYRAKRAGGNAVEVHGTSSGDLIITT